MTSLKWPYFSAFPDPWKNDDPKALQLSHYEAIGTSFLFFYEVVILTLNLYSYIACYSKNSFCTQESSGLLTSIDKLRGPGRDEALQRALGITAPEIDNLSAKTQR